VAPNHQLDKLGQWATNLQKGAYVEVEGELRYREFTPAESDRSERVAEIYASSILLLDRSDRQIDFRNRVRGRTSRLASGAIHKYHYKRMA
jgi:single-stranded DNA-binding protein